MTATQTPPTGTAIVRRQVEAILLTDDARRQIAPFLHKGVSIDHVVSTINQVVAENPDLLECTPVSLVMAVSRGVKWGLDFGETVHLVPFKVRISKPNERPERYEMRAKALRDYKGDIELVVRSGAARAVDAQCFYENEYFKYEQGTHPFIEHHPIVDEKKRGKMLGAYAWALISQRAPLKIAVMSVAEIDKIRQEKSKANKAGELPDWYARKTMVHQVTKAIPKNPRLASVLKEFEQEEIPDAEYEVVSTPEPAAPAATPAEPEAAQPAAAEPPTPNSPATEAQVTRLLELTDDKRVPEKTVAHVRNRLKKGITHETAVKWIADLERAFPAPSTANEDSDDLELSAAQ